MSPAAVVPPPLGHFLSRLGGELEWGQLRVARRGTGFELCHRDDAGLPVEALRVVAVAELRSLADRTADGRFRPLKSAPNLVRGWWCRVSGAVELGEALHALVPGSVVDAWAWETGMERPSTFEAVAARQVGRGKVLTGMTGGALAAVVEAGCGSGRCLKWRRWTAEGVADESGEGKGAVPCLEPCGVFLGFAQACARAEQASTVPVHFAPDDLATLAAALRHVLEHPAEGLREGDMSAPLQPRRVARLLARHQDVWARAAEGSIHAEAHE